MKTAKELKQELKTMCPDCDGSGTIADGIEVMRYGQDEKGQPIEIGTDVEWEPRECGWCYNFDQRLQALCEAFAKEQREICEKAYIDGGFAEDILNAPKPEL
jgi:threonine dehydrogenase-like Zn-dependent dehydrogenase